MITHSHALLTAVTCVRVWCFVSLNFASSVSGDILLWLL